MSELRETARTIVVRHLLDAGEDVVGVEDHSEGVRVDGRYLSWIVRPAAAQYDGFDLYEVAPDEDEDPPPVPHGVAVLADGESFHLNDAEGFRSFWSRAGGALDPGVLPELLARYQHGEYGARLLGGGEDRLWPPPLVEEDAGRVRLRFCAAAVAPAPSTLEDTLTITEWNVDATRGGPIEWTTRPIASGHRTGPPG